MKVNREKRKAVFLFCFVEKNCDHKGKMQSVGIRQHLTDDSHAVPLSIPPNL